jgi:magnesium chelatase family protein
LLQAAAFKTLIKMLIKVFGAAVQGIDATLITIEVNSSRGCMFYMVGLPDSAVKESHQRIISALQVNGYRMPTSNIVINMAPADIRKEGSAYDLPLAIGMLAAAETIKPDKLESYLMMGELSLDGSLQPIKGALSIAIKARELGFKGLIVPKQNAREAAVVNKLSTYGVSNIKEVVEFFNGTKELVPTEVDARKEFYAQQSTFDPDFSEVKGQENVKRALEVAAAGGHNILLIGAPGSGKSMLAKRLPSILPPLSLGESLETTKIHSVAGKLQEGSGLISRRPFRDPHHTISNVAMTGGGSYPQPGEISLAHHGILFLDELPEFNRGVLEVLRQPLEDRKITISRVKGNVEYPASFMLVASMNPCPCGYYNHPTKACVCSPGQVQKYLNRISGPLLDRIDLQIEVIPVPFEKMSDTRASESSSTIRTRVMQARQLQEERYSEYPGIYSNAQMNSKLLSLYAQPDEKGLKLLKNAMQRLNLSARAYDRILKVSRTIADLENSQQIQPAHLAEAIGYRNLDREDWAG